MSGVKRLQESIGILNSLNYSEEFLDLCPDFLENKLPVDSVTLFFLNKEKTEYTPFISNRNTGRRIDPIQDDSHLVIDIKNTRKSLVLKRQTPAKARILARSNPNLFEALRVDVVVPLFSRRELNGFVVIEANRKTYRELPDIVAFLDIIGHILIPQISLERSRIDESRNYYRIYRMDRLALVGELAASAAHEIKNPLAGISTYIRYFAEKDDLTRQDFLKELQVMRESTQRINEIIKSLLSFSKYQAKKVTRLELGQLIDNTLQSIALKIPANIQVIKETSEPLTIESDAQRLQQVLINILFNAVDAIGKKVGQINIRTFVSGRDQLPERELFHVSLRDSGPGIPEAFKEKLFQPFQTTKEEGTGLGLYTCYGLMRSLGGDIKIDSSGRGTEVLLSLPYSYDEEE